MSNLFAAILTGMEHAALLWQLGVLLLCLGGAWQLQRFYRRRLASRQAATKATQALGAGSVQRLVFPLSALLLLLIGRVVLRHWQAVGLLDIAVPLLFSFALIRVTFYLLRHTFAPGSRLRAWEHFIAWLVWIGVALHLSGLGPELVGILDDYALRVGKQRISLLLLVQGALLVLVTLLLALWLGRFIEARLMRAAGLDVNLRVMFSKLAQALLVMAAVMIVLPAVGIDLTVLSVFGGMLGVGIGFGLQKIASNYISGFIILIDRSVSIGDFVTVDGHTGELTKLTARYVVVRSLNGVEAIIPNETIITSMVLNHSYSDRRVRVALPLQISYRSDLETAMRVMVEAARRSPRVLADPAPGALVLRFADSGIDLELGVWIEDPQQGTMGLRSEIYLEIWREFKRHGIEIPYPQREIRLLGATPSSQDSH
ncbi:MAG: mechanosensitive ion channel family protein [Burkholderiales bacterium]